MSSNPAIQDFAFAFLGLLFEGAPFIVLGTLFSGFIDAYLSPNLLTKALPKQKIPAILVAGLLGLVLPVCECAIVPVIRRLIGKGLPVGCAFAYMLAAPIVNPITLFSTYKAFGGDWTMAYSRLGMGYVIAVMVAMIVSALPIGAVLKKHIIKRNGDDAFHDHGKGGKLAHAMRTAQSDFVDVAVYFTLGIAVTSLFNTGVAPGLSTLDSIADSQWGAPASLMGVAFFLSLCSSSDAFVVAALDRFTYSAKLAFLVFGPMVDLKLIFLYQTILRPKFLAAMVVFLFTVTLLACLAWEKLPLP